MEGSYCSFCFTEVSKANRIITDSCGHSKCRNCFILEENVCGQCSKDNLKVTKTSSPIFEQKTTLKSHIINLEGKYKCVVCDKEFCSRQQQYYHFHCDKPEDSRPYRCSECLRGFSKESHLKYHVKTHSQEYLTCDVCKTQFSNQITLAKHIEKHKISKKYKCTICSAEYKDPISFDYHKTKHDPKVSKNIDCSLCGKFFHFKSQLRRHSVIHKRDREKLFECSECNVKFFRGSSLKDHLQKHNSVISFKCGICFKYFSEDKALRRHSNLHDETCFFTCKLCGSVFKRRDNLYRHIRNMHINESSQNSLMEFVKKKQTRVGLKKPIAYSFYEDCVSKKNCNKNLEALDEESNVTSNFIDINKKAVEDPIKDTRVHSPNSSTTKVKPNETNIEKYIQCSVIKSVGNAKPLTVLLTSRSADTNMEKHTLNINAINLSVLANKKLKKKYDPTEIYRKILFANHNGLPISDIINNSTRKNEETETGVSLSKSSTENTKDQTYCTHSNFIEKHWRKSLYN